jgi:hypothetical protein
VHTRNDSAGSRDGASGVRLTGLARLAVLKTEATSRLVTTDATNHFRDGVNGPPFLDDAQRCMHYFHGK